MFEKVFAEEIAETERVAESEKLKSAARKLTVRSKKSCESTEATRRSVRLADMSTSPSIAEYVNDDENDTIELGTVDYTADTVSEPELEALFDSPDINVSTDMGKFGCTVCKKGFRDSSNLKRHVTLVHETRRVAVSCSRSWCSRKFNVLYDMRIHRKGCLKICPFAECLKTYQKLSKYNSHLRAHATMNNRMAD